ncbi:MAG TPA: DUF1559 domain-containing protein [Gemmataceae bacterium]|jgi:hypothetical protein
MMVPKCWSRWRGVGAVVVLLGALLTALLTSETPLPAREEAKTPALPSDLAKVPSDAVFILSGRVADLWNSDLAKPVRQKLAKEIGEETHKSEERFGLRLDQVERFTMVIMKLEGPREEIYPRFFVGTTKAYDRDKVIAAGEKAKEEKYKEQTFYVKGKDWAVYPLDERALVYSTPSGIRAFLDEPAKSDGNLAGALRLAAGKHSAVCGLNVKAFKDATGNELPGEVEPFKPLLQALHGTLTVDVGAESRANVKLTFATEKDAKEALKPARTGLDLARAGFEGGVKALSKQKEIAKFVELLKQVQEALKTTQVEKEGKNLQASVRLKVDVASGGLALIEAVQRAREAAARTQSQNNLKQIGLAMHNYEATNGLFPPQATYDKNGKPLLSWRVLILPYLEQNDLYKQFHLDESWDSEHNKKLLAKMPKTYASPQDETTIADHTTHYQGFFGKGTIFEGKKGIRIADITDGTSNTLMIVEASKAVPWSKPEDIPYDAAKPLPKLGMPGASSFLAGMCDGSIRLIYHDITEKTLRNAITRNDGNPLGPDF